MARLRRSSLPSWHPLEGQHRPGLRSLLPPPGPPLPFTAHGEAFPPAPWLGRRSPLSQSILEWPMNRAVSDLGNAHKILVERVLHIPLTQRPPNCTENSCSPVCSSSRPQPTSLSELTLRPSSYKAREEAAPERRHILPSYLHLEGI